MNFTNLESLLTVIATVLGILVSIIKLKKYFENGTIDPREFARIVGFAVTSIIVISLFMSYDFKSKIKVLDKILQDTQSADAVYEPLLIENIPIMEGFYEGHVYKGESQSEFTILTINRIQKIGSVFKFEYTLNTENNGDGDIGTIFPSDAIIDFPGLTSCTYKMNAEGEIEIHSINPGRYPVFEFKSNDVR